MKNKKCFENKFNWQGNLVKSPNWGPGNGAPVFFLMNLYFVNGSNEMWKG